MAAALGAVAEKSAEAPQAPMVEPTVRTNFADTALWVPSLTTNDHGEATVLALGDHQAALQFRPEAAGHDDPALGIHDVLVLAEEHGSRLLRRFSAASG